MGQTLLFGVTECAWLDSWLGYLGAFVVLFASCFAVATMNSLGPGFVGLIVTTALWASGALTWFVRQYAELEIHMNAAERVIHYCQTIPQEPSSPSVIPSALWPEHGCIEIRDLVIKYRDDLDPVLRGISCSIKAGEKIGVVGRTGAGKSTLTNALFRLIEPTSGSIFIDNIDISQIGLDVLRSRLSIVPQNPVLFSGTIRSNLDPFSRHSDEEIWQTVGQVHLKQHVLQLPEQLGYSIQENGEGLSVGQRQLLCLGRALLRRSKILVMDEATASLDFNTDAHIKATVRECFTAKTLITIAHRLDTVLDSDRVIVFEDGKIAEFDSPSALLVNPGSKFSLLVAAAQKSMK